MNNVIEFPKTVPFKTLDRVTTCDFCIMNEDGSHHEFCLVSINERLKAIGKLEEPNQLLIELAEA